MAEFLAIREAFSIFLKSPWAHSSCLTIERDSGNAINWTVNSSSDPWKAKNISNQIENMKLQWLNWRIKHVYHDSNQVADRLAKEGVHRVSDLLSVLSLSTGVQNGEDGFVSLRICFGDRIYLKHHATDGVLPCIIT
ncbi:hypothetical protein PTKIN_Ptkin11bG0193300 [Pterospermum kingtungense]